MHWDATLDDGRGELLFGHAIRWLLLLYGGRVVPFTIGRASNASSTTVLEDESGALTYGHRYRRRAAVRALDRGPQFRRISGQARGALRRARPRRSANRIARNLETHARRLGGRVRSRSAPRWAKNRRPRRAPGRSSPVSTRQYSSSSRPKSSRRRSSIISTTSRSSTTPGKLKEAFLAVVNTRPADERLIAKNAERVVIARLRDAKLFCDGNARRALASRLGAPAHGALPQETGSYRTGRAIEALARSIAADVFGQAGAADHAATAAHLAKANLTTDMVFKFPELQARWPASTRRGRAAREISKAIYNQYSRLAKKRRAAVEARSSVPLP